MASTKKKPASKKPTVRKKSAAKKPTAKAAVGYKTLRVARSERPFLNLQITRQTVYWTILVAFIVFMQLWILKVQFDVVQATDTLNQQIQQNTQTTVKPVKK